MSYDYLLHHLFLSSCEKCSEKAVIADDKETLTYKDLNYRAAGLAGLLSEYGINRGDRVAFFLDHDINQAISILAISSIGAVFVPVNSLLYPQQIKHIVNDAGARILITTYERFEKIKEIVNEYVSIEKILFTDEFVTDSHELGRSCGAIENDLAAILYTSGSTGAPKGVMISHKNLVSGCWIISDYLRLNSNDSLLGVLPLSFDYGLNQLITMFGQGGTYRFFSFKYPNDIVDALENYKITGFAGIPPIWALLVRSSLTEKTPSALRYITNSGGAVPTAVLNKLRKALPNTQIYLMYGLTEAFRSTYLPPAELDRHPTSMGKAIPNTEILVYKDGRPCKANEPGELIHRGPTVSLGYWKRPEETEKRFKKWPMNGSEGLEEYVVFSGDLVQTDEDGYLYFIGRNDAMIKCSGNRISPSEVEEVVFQMGIIKQAAAIGVPDIVSGQVIKVYVILTDGMNLTQDELTEKLIDFCTERMPNYMVPRYVEILDKMPLTVSGKTDYPDLKSRNPS